jgi:hypothetical protein
MPNLIFGTHSWSPIRAYWEDPSQANRKALRAFLTPETTRWQYTHGVPDQTMVSPDGRNLDNFYLARPGADEVQLDLLGDYKSNVALYSSFQEYFRTHKPPLLAVWGKNDPFFVPAGAEAFKRDNPRAVCPLLRHWSFRLRNACPRNRRKYPRFPEIITSPQPAHEQELTSWRTLDRAQQTGV